MGESRSTYYHRHGTLPEFCTRYGISHDFIDNLTRVGFCVGDTVEDLLLVNEEDWKQHVPPLVWNKVLRGTEDMWRLMLDAALAERARKQMEEEADMEVDADRDVDDEWERSTSQERRALLEEQAESGYYDKSEKERMAIDVERRRTQ